MGKGKEGFFLLYALRFLNCPVYQSMGRSSDISEHLRDALLCPCIWRYYMPASPSFKEVSSSDCLSNTAQQAVTTAFCCIRTKLKIRCKFLNASFPLTYICHLHANAAPLFDLTCASQAVSLTWLEQWWGWASVKSWSTLDCPNVLGS